jgi:hypothetical protein
VRVGPGKRRDEAIHATRAVMRPWPPPPTGFGTYAAVFEQGEGVTELDEVRPGEFIAQVTAREV